MIAPFDLHLVAMMEEKGCIPIANHIRAVGAGGWNY